MSVAAPETAGPAGRRAAAAKQRLKIGQYLFDRPDGKVLFGGFVSILCAHAAFLARTSLQRSAVLR